MERMKEVKSSSLARKVLPAPSPFVPTYLPPAKHSHRCYPLPRRPHPSANSSFPCISTTVAAPPAHLSPSSSPAPATGQCRLSRSLLPPAVAVLPHVSCRHLCCRPAPPLLPHLPPLLLPPASAASTAPSSHQPSLSFPTPHHRLAPPRLLPHLPCSCHRPAPPLLLPHLPLPVTVEPLRHQPSPSPMPLPLTAIAGPCCRSPHPCHPCRRCFLSLGCFFLRRPSQFLLFITAGHPCHLPLQPLQPTATTSFSQPPAALGRTHPHGHHLFLAFPLLPCSSPVVAATRRGLLPTILPCHRCFPAASSALLLSPTPSSPSTHS
ncbi:hypothetical protein BHM03_00032150, partial [Ensete ventricosum]